MGGKLVNNVSLKRKDQATTLASKNAFKIRDETVQIDPNLMFQRLASSIVKSEDTLEEALKHELCTFPPSLFETVGVLNEARKPQLLDVISSMAVMSPQVENSSPQFVLDGGALLQKIPWDKQSSFKEITEKYVSFVKKTMVIQQWFLTAMRSHLPKT